MEVALDRNNPALRASVQADLMEQIPHLVPIRAGARWWMRAVDAELARREIAMGQRRIHGLVPVVAARLGTTIPKVYDAVPDMPLDISEADLERLVAERLGCPSRIPRGPESSARDELREPGLVESMWRFGQCPRDAADALSPACDEGPGGVPMRLEGRFWKVFGDESARLDDV
jgi:hypothetical protein